MKIGFKSVLVVVLLLLSASSNGFFCSKQTSEVIAESKGWFDWKKKTILILTPPAVIGLYLYLNPKKDEFNSEELESIRTEPEFIDIRRRIEYGVEDPEKSREQFEKRKKELSQTYNSIRQNGIAGFKNSPIGKKLAHLQEIGLIKNKSDLEVIGENYYNIYSKTLQFREQAKVEELSSEAKNEGKLAYFREYCLEYLEKIREYLKGKDYRSASTTLITGFRLGILNSDIEAAYNLMNGGDSLISELMNMVGRESDPYHHFLKMDSLAKWRKNPPQLNKSGFQGMVKYFALSNEEADRLKDLTIKLFQSKNLSSWRSNTRTLVQTMVSSDKYTTIALKYWLESFMPEQKLKGPITIKITSGYEETIQTVDELILLSSTQYSLRPFWEGILPRERTKALVKTVVKIEQNNALRLQKKDNRPFSWDQWSHLYEKRAATIK